MWVVPLQVVPLQGLAYGRVRLHAQATFATGVHSLKAVLPRLRCLLPCGRCGVDFGVSLEKIGGLLEGFAARNGPIVE